MLKFSLVITTYNRASLLEMALLSVRSQSIQPSELIVSDDGSTENILGTVQSFAEQCQIPITFVSQADKGFRLAKCRNNAIKLAKHEFILFMDQDIIYTRHYFETFMNHAQSGLFLTSYPVRLTKEQSLRLHKTSILNADYTNILTSENYSKIQSQYRKEWIYFWQKKIFHDASYKPKIRGGASGLFKADIYKVNGFDENFEGWGNEDDDFGLRLYSAGIMGKNVFKKDFPIHIWHEPFHTDGHRVNKQYYESRKNDIRKGTFRAVKGLQENDDEQLQIIRFNQ